MMIEEMATNSMTLTKIVVWTCLVFIVGILPVYRWGGTALANAVWAGFWISLFNILFSYFSISWSFQKPIKTFYSIIFAGMAVRLILFAVGFFVIHRSGYPVFGFVISFFIFYILLQYYEIQYINQQLSSKSSTRNESSHS